MSYTSNWHVVPAAEKMGRAGAEVGILPHNEATAAEFLFSRASCIAATYFDADIARRTTHTQEAGRLGLCDTAWRSLGPCKGRLAVLASRGCPWTEQMTLAS